jgi:hypothetical protein
MSIAGTAERSAACLRVGTGDDVLQADGHRKDVAVPKSFA